MVILPSESERSGAAPDQPADPAPASATPEPASEVEPVASAPVESAGAAPDALPADGTAPPRAVLISFWLLLVSAAIKLFFAVLTIGNWNGLLDEAVRATPAGTSSESMRSYVQSALTINVVVDVTLCVLYVLLAYLARRGRNWARIAVTVLVVVFGLINTLAGGDLYTIITLLVELTALVLLYVPSAKPHFARRP